MENIRAQQWYNEDLPRNLHGYLNDKTHRLVGWITMRQIRMKSSSCFDRRIRSQCVDDYHRSNEEKSSYQPGWINQSKEIYSSSIIKAFQYQFNDQGGYVYEYRGSLMNLRSNLSLLHRLQWIDEQTRAIVIQSTLYNPNVQLFTSVTLLAEFFSTGGVVPSSRFQPIPLFSELIRKDFSFFEIDPICFSSFEFIRSIDFDDYLHRIDDLFNIH